MEKQSNLSERESLRLIAETIQQAKAGYYHDSGVGAILWGSVVSIAGFMTFLQLQLNWPFVFDWWLLTFFALIPQIIISRKERKKMVVRTHEGVALDTVWVIFGVSIFAIIFYLNVAPVMAEKFLSESGFVLLIKNLETGAMEDFSFRWGFSPGSLFLLLYALPTMVTGVVKKFRPMIVGACITYLFFIASLFTQNPLDQLMMGISGLINWLIPGLILSQKYKKAPNEIDV